ncbi:undecaprenyldiphospho-muramoylpentapeptide beta-N-acetylglucosaminyltransferase [Nocardioides koreensis]|uniref:UDP-N-acetylglucosamine--N-acetylmuramyl-(pentapeptide) pyrophosphoryl-undecaprenol N-acetylglucosamine transferase n=1 Tax=Nocardioides koreensis TaxID=433651 RepID=A0ABN2ZZZ9_9ACTN
MSSQHPAELRLLVTGGGTGGHTYPALTIVPALTARLAAYGVATRVLWAGDPDGLEATVAASAGIAFQPLATGKVRRARTRWGMLTARNAGDMARVARGVVQARSVVRHFRPDVVLSTGGYAAVPIGLAARQLRLPLVVHEQTVRLGLANRVLVRGAARVAVSESSTLDLLPPRVRERTVVTGNPIRPELLAGEPSRAIAALGLHAFDPGKPVVYVTGGAQGAVQINRLVSESLPWLLDRANVIHQCGASDVDALAERAAGLPAHLAARYRALGFLTDALPDVLALADLVVSRSGAGTIAELTALGRASVLVPLASSAGDEQAHNARRLRDVGAAAVLEGEVSSAQLESALGPLLGSGERRQAMARAAGAHGRPDAAQRLVDVLIEAAGAAAGR